MRFFPLASLALVSILAGCGGDPEPASNGSSRPDGVARRPEEPAPDDLAAGIRRRVLENGLTVLIREKHSTPVVTCELAFKVGAVDESDPERGMAHFLEHMLFKGSTSFKKGEIDWFTMKNGGSNNAYTSRDMTAYHFSMPSSGLEAALKILTEMLGQSTLDVTEFEAEKGPVLEELRAGKDDPWNRLWEASLEKTYQKHPYRHPVIGYEPVIVAMKRDAMKEFYDKYYKPTNAVFVIVGDVDAEKTFARIEELCGKIPAGTPVPKMEIVEPEQNAEVRFELKEPTEVDRLHVAWRGPKVGEADDYVMDLIQTLLASGRTSRLHQRLVEKDRLSSSVYAWNYSGRFPGTFLIQTEALPGADRAAIEKAIDEELARLGSEGPTAAELEKARNSLSASFIFRAESAASLADMIAEFACKLTVDELGQYVKKVNRVTAEEVKAGAKKYFRKETRTVGWSIAQEGEGGGGGGGGQPKRLAPRRQAGREPGAGPAGGVSLANAKRIVLDNGMVLLLLENHDLPIFSLQSFVRASQLYESEDQAGLANLVGLCLEDGTEKRSAEEIALAIENVGGRLGTGAAGVEATVLAKDQDLALDLVFDILCNAKFPEDMLSLRRDQVLAEIAANRDIPRELARNAFSETVYGRHPLHRPAAGYEDTVKSLTRDHLLAHYRKYFIPNNAVVAIAGDFDAGRVEKRVRELTASWKMQLLDFPPVEEAVKAAKGKTTGIPFATGQQVNVYIGHLGIRRNDPDYYALQVMDHVLGSGSGFTDRLSKKIRDEMGLVYAVGASITSSAGIEPGMFRIFFASKPATMEAAMKVLNEEMDRIRKEKVSAEELDLAKSYLLGSFVFGYETNEQLADALVMVERFGLGFDYPKKYLAEISKVNADDVLRVAKKHLDPGAFSKVIAGPVNEAGEVVERK